MNTVKRNIQNYIFIYSNIYSVCLGSLAGFIFYIYCGFLRGGWHLHSRRNGERSFATRAEALPSQRTTFGGTLGAIMLAVLPRQAAHVTVARFNARHRNMAVLAGTIATSWRLNVIKE